MSGDPVTYQKLDMTRLRRTILSRRPQLTLTALAGPNDSAEFGEKEVWRPSWLDPWGARSETDYNVEAWPAYLRVPAVVEAYHWGTIVPPAQGMARLNGPQMFRYTVLQAGVGTEGTGIAWAASPYTDGTWENNLGSALTNLSSHVQPISESLKHVLPSTSYPTAEGVWLTNLPNGIVATRSVAGNIEYIHVLNPPAGKTLSLPMAADGRKFVSASLLPGSHAVALGTNNNGISLTLGAADGWNALNTVVKLQVELSSLPQPNFAWHKAVSASSSVQFGPSWGKTTPWGRIRLVDGQIAAMTANNGWSSGNCGFSTKARSTSGAEWVSLDLESTNWVNEVRLHPRNDSGNVGFGFPVSFDISTSSDGLIWTPAVMLAGQARPSAVQTFNFVTRPARYVRLNASQLRANPGESGNYALQLAEMQVFGLVGLSPLSIQRRDQSVVLQWTNGVLQSADSLMGTFTDMTGAVSPFTHSAVAPRRFFRLKY
jgi:hypothetical protein